MTHDDHRLPGTIRPRYYDVHIQADPSQDIFQGQETIWIVSDEPTRTFTLHARGMDITQADIKQGNTYYRGEPTIDEDDETLTITFPEKVPAGQGRLILEYTAPISEGMAGLYLSKSGDEECLVTQCEATDARAVFPCFDEPPYKANLRWTITAPQEHTVLANGALDEKTDNADDTTTWTFKPTPPISTYLAALAIGPFQPTETAHQNDVPFRVWALAGKHALGKHARDFATDLLPWFEDYFATDYPYKKYDQLAVPSFAFGAMENVGLVVFRDTLLLLDEATASWQDRKSIDRVVAHEFAHMWFGNLVTMEWWDDLWLNEAFAEWIAHKAVHHLEPTHQTWHDFQRRTHQALQTDALETTHPIYHPVETPEQAMEMFDAITYGKGSATMRMLEAYLGEEPFRHGLRTYMETHAQKNAQGQDLWDHLAKASDEPVEEIMQAWITQPGHPTLHATLEADTLTLTQDRAQTTPATSPENHTWPLPLVIRYGHDGQTHEHRHLLTEEQETLTLPHEPDWVYPNADSIGVHRTHLEDPQHDALLDHIQHLTPTERTRLLHDEWANTLNQKRDPERYLTLLETLTQDPQHHAVHQAITHHLERLETLLTTHGTPPALDGLRAWTREHISPHLPDPLPPPRDDAPSEGTRRAAILHATAGIGHDPNAREAALALAEQERDDPTSIHPDLAATAVKLNARFGDETTYEEHQAAYETRRDEHRPPQTIQRYLQSLPQFQDATIVDAILETLHDGTIPKQDIGPLLSSLLAHPHSQQAAFKHIRTNIDTLKQRIGPSWVTRIVEATSNLPPNRRQETIQFWEKSLNGLAQEALKRTDERMRHRAHLIEHTLPTLANLFEEHA